MASLERQHSPVSFLLNEKELLLELRSFFPYNICHKELLEL